MVDALCSSKFITKFPLFIPHYIPSKPLLPTQFFHHSNQSKRTRNRRKNLYVTCLCTPNSPDFDVISTHEHSDGSLLFRFGNPSEVVKNDQLSETNVESEEMDDDENEDFNVVKVLDGDHKSEVIIKKIDGEVMSNNSIEVVDEANSVAVSSEIENVGQKEHSSSEKLSSSFVEDDIPVSIPSIELNDSSQSISAVENDLLVEESLEVNDSSISLVEVDQRSIEKDGVETSDVSNLSSEKLSSSSIKVETPASVSSIELNKSSRSIVEVEDAIHVEESSTEKDGHESSAALNHISELEGNEASVETLEPIIHSNSLLESISVKPEPVVEVLNDDVPQDTTTEKVKVVQSSTNAEALNVEAGTQNEIIDESSVIEMMPQSLLSEAEPILVEEADIETIDESSELDRTEDAIMNKNSSESVLEVERTKEMVESDELVDVSTSEVLELKSTELSEVIPLPKLLLSTGASVLQHPQEVLTGGEDAYFTCQSWLGVADGVGQWSLDGVNPGMYALELMENCEKIVSDCNYVPLTAPEEVLNLAVAKAQSPGASTVLIAHFDGQALHVANIGDSGFIILRNQVVYQRSSPMLHEFNFPVQIERGDDPSKLKESYRIDLDEGDVVIMATDGLFDNLYEQEIISIVLKSLEANKNPEEIAEILAMRAVEIGSSKSARTPFADEAQASGYVGYTGGKLDDVAVIVSLVKKAPDSSVS